MSPGVTDLLLEKVGFVHEQNLNQETNESSCGTSSFAHSTQLKNAPPVRKAQVKWTFTGPLVWIGKIAFKGGILSGKTGFFSPGLDLKHATI